MSTIGPEAGSPITAAIRTAQAERGRGAFVPFLTAGYPSLDATVEIGLELAAAGADLLEIGIPFSDPLADGPVIQRSSQHALAAGVTPASCLDTIARLTARTKVPVVVMTYLNPVMQLPGGLAVAARECGCAGIILTDLPFDQPHEVWQQVAASGLDRILLVTPTTPPERVREIARHAGGFIYCVTRLGVTGQGVTAWPELEERLTSIRAATPLPVLAGFGVASAADAECMGRLADGVVVGSALVACVAGSREPVRAVRELATAIVGGLTAAGVH